MLCDAVIAVAKHTYGIKRRTYNKRTFKRELLYKPPRRHASDDGRGEIPQVVQRAVKHYVPYDARQKAFRVKIAVVNVYRQIQDYCRR